MDARQASLQRHRLRMTLLSVVNSMFQSGVIALYAVSGATSWPLAAAFALASLGTTGLFALGVARSWLLFLGDARLLYAQIGVNFVIQIVFMIAAPSLWMIFLASTLITCSYAMVAFTPRQFTWLWLGYGATTAIALFVGRHRFSTPAPTDLNIAVLWLFFFVGVRRLSLTGAQFTKLRAQLSEKNRQLTLLLAHNKALASHDELTGAFNRRELMQLLGQECERARRTRAPFSIAIFDLDHFKRINDDFGHAVGDAVLRRFCELVTGAMRTNDHFARYGGEEFVLLMPTTTTDESALSAADRIRALTGDEDWRTVLGGAERRVTVSTGVATWRPDETLEALLARADAALYEAKHRGRNQCSLAGDPAVGAKAAAVAVSPAPEACAQPAVVGAAR